MRANRDNLDSSEGKEFPTLSEEEEAGEESCFLLSFDETFCGSMEEKLIIADPATAYCFVSLCVNAASTQK